MTELLSSMGMYQVFIIGTFFDSKHQLESQRLWHELQFQAHKDYQPSEQFCWIGSSARSLAPSEQISRFNTEALNARQMGRHLGNFNIAGSQNRDQDKAARWERFTKRYCNPEDNNWSGETGTGLKLACGKKGGGKSELLNIDIDYTRLIENRRSLNAAFYREGLSKPMIRGRPDPNEQDIIAMGNNLYGHNVLTRKINKDYLKDPASQKLYLALRSVAAKRAVAESSYNAIVGLKTYGSSDDPDKDYRPTEGGPDTPETHRYLAAVLAELGVGDENGNGTNADEIYTILGERPSYYAQLEVLAKKLYQTSNFFADLYDKPVNIARRGVAMQAIELMLDRAIYESELRQELATSVLLSTRMRGEFDRLAGELPGGN